MLILAVATLLLPFQASALSVRQYESQSKTQRAETVATAIDKIVADVDRVNPTLSKTIHEYFYVIPQGQPGTPGLIAFGTELVAVENRADQGKLDLDKVQIEGILLDVVKTGVIKKQPPKDKQPSAAQ